MSFKRPCCSVLRDNPLVCSCELHWLQQWQLTGRGDVDSQMMTCYSNDLEIPLNSLMIENCSEFGFLILCVCVCVPDSLFYTASDGVTSFQKFLMHFSEFMSSPFFPRYESDAFSSISVLFRLLGLCDEQVQRSPERNATQLCCLNHK